MIVYLNGLLVGFLLGLMAHHHMAHLLCPICLLP